MNIKRACLSALVSSSLFFGCPSPTPPPQPPRPPVSQVSGEIDNNNPSYLARASYSGIDYEFWGQRDDAGNLDYISDVRVTLPNRDSIFLQQDALERPTYFENERGMSVRVNYYTDSLANITISDGVRKLTGEVYRDFIDNGNLSSPYDFPNFDDGYSDDTDVPFEILKNSSSICTGVGVVTENYKLLSKFKSLISLAGCLGSIGFDVVTFPTAIQSVAGCAGSYAVSSAVTTALTTGAQEVSNFAFGCSFNQVDMMEIPSPVMPPTTGRETLSDNSLRFTLTWNNGTDLDLWVTDPRGEKIYYGNMESSSGGRLNQDHRQGYGPEIIHWNYPPRGTYNVSVDYYTSNGYGPSNYTLQTIMGTSIDTQNGMVGSGQRDDYYFVVR